MFPSIENIAGMYMYVIHMPYSENLSRRNRCFHGIHHEMITLVHLLVVPKYEIRRDVNLIDKNSARL